MTPIKFDESDRVLGAGDNPNTGNLPIVTALDPTLPAGFGVIVSCWEPSEEELIEFMKTKRIYVGVMCHLSKPTQPPIYALGINPFNALGWQAIQFRRDARERMFKGNPGIMDLAFRNDERSFAMTVTSGEGSFTLHEVVEMFEDKLGEAYGPETKEYFKAWEILSGKYTEI